MATGRPSARAMRAHARGSRAGVLLVGAVGEVEADHVDAGLDQQLRASRGRARPARWWPRSWCGACLRKPKRRPRGGSAIRTLTVRGCGRYIHAASKEIFRPQQRGDARTAAWRARMAAHYPATFPS